LKTPELLAPAGSLKVLKAAINTGADAVYFGLESFSARSSAVNFTKEEAKEGFDYLKLRGKKGYVTLNTLIKDSELNSVKEEIKFLSSVGADGIIVQDFGVVNLIRECAPDMPVHASTQMTVHNLEGVELLRKMGIERVVLSRELPISDIEYIKKNTPCELEIFIHGALCVCYSGQCYLSSFIGERSGNRGKCAQPCRLPYQLGNSKGTLLSLKDMESTGYIGKIKELGIDSLKIEGRLKNEYYTAVVVDAYKTLLSGETLSRESKDMLFNIFNRGGYTTYFDGEKNKMFCFNKNEIPYNETEKKAEEKFKDIIKDESIPKELKTPLFMRLTLAENELPVLYGKTGEKEATVFGDEKCEKALSGNLNRERIKENLSKLGNTPFTTDEIEIDSADDVFIRISEINSLRRKLTDKLYEKRKIVFTDKELNKGRRKPSKELSFAISVKNKEQYEWAKGKNAEFIIARADLILEDEKPDLERTVISLSPIITVRESERVGEQIEKLKEKGLRYGYCENISHLEFFKDFEKITGSRMNITNSESLEKLDEISVVTASKELNLKDIGYLLKDKKLMAEGYGYQSMMITENCIKKESLGKCVNRLSYLKDRRGQNFPVMCEEGCRNEILNSCPLVMSDKLSQMKKSGINCVLMSFTVESADECEQIYSCYESEENPFSEFTRGHFFRGVL